MRKKSKEEALTAFLALADADPVPAPEDWDAFKDDLEADLARDRSDDS